MIVTMSELKCREVINICDGCRIGFVSDLELDCTGGNVVAIIVPGKAKFFGLFGREDDYVIPWLCCKRIGDDLILVDGPLAEWRTPRKKRRLF